MKIRHTALAVWLGILAFSTSAFSQVASPEASLSSAIATARKQYAASFAAHPQLYNGPEYLDYTRRYYLRTGHQYFLSPDMHAGSVAYNDDFFSDLLLAYDVVLDQVVLSQPNSSLTLRLVNENVQSFSVTTHRFVRLVADSTTRAVIRTGFYEVLFDSTVQVMAKRAKRMQEHLTQSRLNVEFTPTDKLFIRKDGQYFPVASKSSVLRLFSDRAKELQKYVQETKLRFNKAQREASIIQLTSYYCSLPSR